jgi:uncharacterized protein
VLILLPPSEAKNPPPENGVPVDLDALSFPELTSTRANVMGALATTSSRKDALDRLLAGKSLAAEVARNIDVASLPTRRALDTYRGALFGALDAQSLSSVARRRAATRLVIVSALWGALRPQDSIPPYRLNICSNLVGLGSLEPMWREVLGPVLAEAAGRSGMVVDLRSSSFQAVGMPEGIGERTSVVRVVRDSDHRGASSYASKYTRGKIARYLLESGANPSTPQQLAEALADQWQVEITPPSRSGQRWRVDVVAPG